MGSKSEKRQQEVAKYFQSELQSTIAMNQIILGRELSFEELGTLEDSLSKIILGIEISPEGTK